VIELLVLLRLAAAALLGAVNAAGPAMPVATPIGRGARFQLSTGVRADRGAPIGRLRCTRPAGLRRVAHLEVFARGRVVIVPPGVGVARPRRQVGAAVRGGRCSYPLRTTDPTGVIRYRAGARLTLGDVFAVWGQPLGRRRLCGFRGRVRVYVDGRLLRGDPRAVTLRDRAEIVVEVGEMVPPHRSYLFPAAAASA
jgi:hypothetical protein